MVSSPAHRRTRTPAITGITLLAALAAGCEMEPTPGGTLPTAPTASRAGAGPIAEVFSDGVISSPSEEWRITFTPDGKTAYFARSPVFFPFSRRATIYVSHQVSGAWSTPEVASFSGRYSDIDPFLSPDGQRLYFSSIRPVDGTIRGDIDLWYVERTASGWSDAVHLGPEVNTPADELYPSVSGDGTLYFASGPFFPQPGKHFDIYAAERSGDGFAPRVALSAAVNAAPAGAAGEGLQDAWDFNPEVSVDGHTLVFTSLRPGGYGLGDLYVSHRRGGEWLPARNVGPAVNTEYDEYHPTLSRNGRELYFVRRIYRPDPFLFVRGDFYRIETRNLDAFHRGR